MAQKNFQQLAATWIRLWTTPAVLTAAIVDKALGVRCPLFSASKRYRKWRG